MNNQKEYYQIGGNLKPDDRSYIEREADKNLYEALKAGKFCYVFNSRQMGKSSLIVRVRKKLENESFKCVSISLDRFGTQGLTQDQWYYTFIKNVAEPLNLERELLSKFWDDSNRLTPLERLNNFFAGILLAEPSEKFIIFIDEIDAVLGLDFSADDFFIFIRYCYNQRAEKPEYNRITFALLGVATPSQLIKNIQLTPFNIGEAIQLNWFSFNEALPLAKGLETRVSKEIAESILREVLNWTGGQPFLTQRICKIIAEEKVTLSSEEEISKWVEEIVKLRIINDWESQDKQQHLRTLRDRIINSSEPTFKLLNLYLKILQNQEIKTDDSPEQSELILSGLVLEKNRTLKISNAIYKYVFDANWVAEILAEKRPYEEELLGWKANKNNSWLLRGQKLSKSMLWTVGKNLTIEDYQFLNASQELAVKRYHNFQRSLFFIITILLLGVGAIGFQITDKIKSIFIPYILQPELFSQGERSFFIGNPNYYQSEGVKEFKKGNYEKAIKLFEKSKSVDLNDPEAEIYYNNALAHQREKDKNIKPLTLGVVVPIDANRNSAIDQLRGVALAQKSFNEQVGLQGRLLNIVIANDSNNPELAQKVAKELTKDSNVLGVIGHNASGATLPTLDEYDKAGLAMISPSSSSTLLKNKVFFRTVQSNEVTAKSLAKYAIKQNIKRVVVYYKPEDVFSDDIKQNFHIAFRQQGGEVVRFVDLGELRDDASDELIRIATRYQADAAVFFPNTDLVFTVFDVAQAQTRLSKKLQFLGAASLYNSGILRQDKQVFEGLVLAVPWFSEGVSKKFAQTACDRWKAAPEWGTASSYDAAQAFIQVMSKSNNPSRKTVLENLESIKLSPEQTSGYPLQFTDGERQNAKPVLVRVVKGSGEKCGGLTEGGFHFEKLEEKQLSPK